MSDDVLDREGLRGLLFECAGNAGAADAVLAHDAALRERVEELEEALEEITNYRAPPSRNGPMTVVADLMDRARQALDTGDSDADRR